MKNYFKIDFNRLAVLLLPPSLRSADIKAWAIVLIVPVVWLYAAFTRWRTSNLYHLSITAQVCKLERVLNDRFDRTRRRIYITKGVYYPETFIFTNAEGMDEYLGTTAEGDMLPIYTRGEVGAESADFIINIPTSVRFNEAEMRAVVDIYKCECKTYIINKI